MTWSDWTDDPDGERRDQRSGESRSDWIGEWLGEAQRKATRSGPGAPPPWVAGLLGLVNGTQERQQHQRAKRGDVRAGILDVLADAGDDGLNGYQIIRQIGERSGGAWQPSPGSVYPTIQQLLDEGLIHAEDDHGKRTLRLSPEGRDHLAGREAEQAQMWAGFAPAAGGTAGLTSEIGRLRPELGKLFNALWQVATNGTEQQRNAAIEVLADARRKLYGILATDPAGEVAATSAEDAVTDDTATEDTATGEAGSEATGAQCEADSGEEPR